MHVDIHKIGQNIVRIRKLRGLSQKDLAEKTGISRRAIIYYERESKNDFLEKIERIASALDVSAEELLSFDGKKKENSSDEIDFTEINMRTLKRIKQIINLTPQDRQILYKTMDGLLATKILGHEMD